MALEDSGTIDMVGDDAGNLLLVITDSGVTEDPEMRLALLKRKLQTYGMALSMPRLQEQMPNYRTARIRVMCALPATSRMKAIDAISVPHGSNDIQRVEVVYQELPSRF